MKVCGIMLGLALFATPVQAMAEPQPDEQAESAREVPNEQAALRERLERTIERNEAMLERHREALERLTAGESPREVLRMLRWRSGPREGARPAPGPDREQAPRVERRSPELTPEAKARLRQFLKEHLPSMDTQLTQVEAVDERAADRLFERLAPQIREVASDMDRDPDYGRLKLGELRAGLAVVDATQRLRMLGPDAAESERAKAEKSLREAISARFDARIRLREHELERLANRLTELHRQIRDEQATREYEIERVFDSITAHRWTAPQRVGNSPERPGRP